MVQNKRTTITTFNSIKLQLNSNLRLNIQIYTNIIIVISFQFNVMHILTHRPFTNNNTKIKPQTYYTNPMYKLIRPLRHICYHFLCFLKTFLWDYFICIQSFSLSCIFFLLSLAIFAIPHLSFCSPNCPLFISF